MGKFKVWLYRDKRGNSPITEFIIKVNSKQEAKIQKQILHLTDYGITIQNTFLRRISGTVLWEVRILGRDNIRIFCANTIHGIAVLHIFFKKSQKTPERDISLALKRLEILT